MPGSLGLEGRSVSDASHAVLAMASDALRAIRKDGFLLYRRFRNVSIARKLYFTVGAMALLIGVELFVLLFCLNTLSSLRAYVGGEGLWSKAQKDAVFHLYKYAFHTPIRTTSSLNDLCGSRPAMPRRDGNCWRAVGTWMWRGRVFWRAETILTI